MCVDEIRTMELNQTKSHKKSAVHKSTVGHLTDLDDPTHQRPLLFISLSQILDAPHGEQAEFRVIKANWDNHSFRMPE